MLSGRRRMPDPASTSRPFARALGIALRSTLAASVLIAIVDLALSASRATEPVPFFAWVRALEAAIGLYGALGLFVGLGAGIVAGGVVATLPLGASLRGWRARLRS